MGFFDKVRDALTTSDAERSRTAPQRDAPGPQAPEAATPAPPAAGEQDDVTGDGAEVGSGTETSRPARYRTHTVRHGDTLAGIAGQHGVDAAAMAELNRIDNPDLIYPGQVLRVPHA